MQKEILILFGIVILAATVFVMVQETDKMARATTFEGIAQNAKGGAVLVTSDKVIYLKGWDSWPNDSVIGKKVKVEGILKQEKYLQESTVDEKGAISQGTSGPSMDYVLYNPVVKK